MQSSRPSNGGASLAVVLRLIADVRELSCCAVVAFAVAFGTRSPDRCPAHSTATARCVERRMARHFVVARALGPLISDGFRATNSLRTTSPLQVTTEASAASAGHLFLAALTAIRLLTAFLLGRSMMILASNPSFMYLSHTKRRGLTLPMSYHNFRSFQRKLPNRPFDTDLRKRASPTCSAIAFESLARERQL